MNTPCETHHAEKIRLFLENLSSCIEAVGEQMELLNELRDEIESEFDEYTDETDELEIACAHLSDELDSARAVFPTSDKKENLQKLFVFDVVIPMTQPERVAVFNFILSEQNDMADICWKAGNYLTEYRKDICHSGDSELPFDSSFEETIANLL